MVAELSLYFGIALAGLLSFLSPCVLPLVPPYLTYLGGTTLDQMTGSDDEGAGEVYRRVLAGSVFFVLGFTTVFVLLGAGVSVFGQSLLAYRDTLSMLAGIIIILFGLHFLGVFRVGLFYREARYRVAAEPASYAGAYLIGLAFAFGWTPCIGPVLAAILALVANQASPATGVSMLLAYSLGLGVPFVLAAAAIRPFLSFSQRFRPHLARVEKIMGVLLVVAGLLFLTGSINALGNWMLETFPALGQIEESLGGADLSEQILEKTRQP